MGKRVERWAVGSLLLALGVAALGLWLRESKTAEFWGGLVLAFGEAALVGGLADWFAVRALFAHPFGVPFPHTAVIPRNRRRIAREIRRLVETEWLPATVLTARIKAFDFVGQGLLPALGPLRPRLRELLRGAVREALTGLHPDELAGFLTRAAAGGLASEQLAPFLAGLTRRARDRGWLDPLLRELVRHLQQWAGSRACREAIERHLGQAAEKYRGGGGWFREFTYNFAEALGGIDLQAAADTLQSELQRYAAAQREEGSDLQRLVHDGLESFERRLEEDEAFQADLRRYLQESAEDGTLREALAPLLESLRQEGLRELEAEDSRLLEWALERLDGWLRRLGDDAEARGRLNDWCRKQAAELIERHHGEIGVMVEEQMGRLSDEALTKLIQDRVGEDLNWIRLNGTFVGGMVGAALYLLFMLATVCFRGGG
jgi:uncharacterized membrane-anchored protein YjiN (DUF445 family)